MHIVYVSGEHALWATGGVGVFIQTLSRALVNLGHKVSVVGVGNSFKEEYIEDEGVAIYRLPKNKTKLPDFISNSALINKKLKKLHKQSPIDIIETAEGGLAFLSKNHPAKKVIRLHGGHHFFAEAEKRNIHWKKGWIEKKSFKKADAFIAISNYVKNHTAKYLSYHNKPQTIIPNAINTNIEIPQVAVNPNCILFAGTICGKKGVRQLLEAFKIVRQKYPEKELHLYGRLNWKFPDGRLYVDVIKTQLDPSFFEQVHFKGAVDRKTLDDAYANASLCVFPSHMETQGLVCIEAMLLEKPVVFSKYGPGPETISHQETGLLCDVYNPSDIANKILWCIDNPTEALALGKKARAVVLEKYNLKEVTRLNVNFYKSLL